MTMMILGMVAGVLIPAVVASWMSNSSAKIGAARRLVELEDELAQLSQCAVIPPQLNRRSTTPKGRGFVAPTRRRPSHVSGLVNV
jgi:hypothetical protein